MFGKKMQSLYSYNCVLTHGRDKASCVRSPRNHRCGGLVGGQRDGNKVNSDYGIGGYWSSTSLYDEGDFNTNYQPTIGYKSYILELGTEGSKGYNPAKKILKHYGCSVRLVRDLN